MRNDPSSLRGVIAPILTPFNDDLSIADDLYAALAKRLLDAGVAAIAPFGTTGEALSVAPDERIAAMRALIDAGAPAERMLPGVGLCDLPSTMRLSIACLEMGCPAVMTLPPFYYKDATEDGLFRYYGALIDGIGRARARILLYHIPQVAGVGLPITLVKRLRDAFPDQILGVKDSSGDWANTSALLKIGGGFAVYPSSETLLAQAHQRGGAGCVSATLNVNPEDSARIFAALEAGDAPEPADLERAATVRKLFMSAGFIAPQKRLLARATGDARWATTRPPLQAAPEAEGARLAEALAHIDGFEIQV